MLDFIKKVQQSCVYDVVDITPLDKAHKTSAKLKNNIFFKREDKQKQHSFKLRGAYQKIKTLSKAEQKKGIVAASAGNHAQGVAYCANALNINSIIVMPVNTPEIKVDAVKDLGSEVILYGDNFDESLSYVRQIVDKTGKIFIPPFDDEAVITGQATVALELSKQLKTIDYVFVPVGGGGLISGIALYLKSLNSAIKIIAVEPQTTPTLAKSLQQQKPVLLKQVGLFAEGVAVKKIGQIPFDISRQYVDDVVLVSDDEMCAAIKDIFEDVRSIVEPSGALSLAGCQKYLLKNKKITKKNIVTVLSGANVNFDRLRYISERADFGEHKEAIFAVKIKEETGSFYRFCQALGKKRVVTEFNYRFASKKQAYIFVGVALKNGLDEQKKIVTQLENKGYFAEDMTNNDMAKTHIRYMVGGRATVKNERLYRFMFPEKPGALLNFLESIAQQWNISLFHYRNHGASFGRVLVGIQAENKIELEQAFDKLSYDYIDESNNHAFKFFL